MVDRGDPRKVVGRKREKREGEKMDRREEKSKKTSK